MHYLLTGKSVMFHHSSFPQAPGKAAFFSWLSLGLGGTKSCYGQLQKPLGIFVVLFTSCLGCGTAPWTELLTHRSCFSLGMCLPWVSHIFLGQQCLEAAWGALINPEKSQGHNPLLRPVLLQNIHPFPSAAAAALEQSGFGNRES